MPSSARLVMGHILVIVAANLLEVWPLGAAAAVRETRLHTTTQAKQHSLHFSDGMHDWPGPVGITRYYTCGHVHVHTTKY